MATKNTSSVRVPRRAEGIRIALALANIQHRTNQGLVVTTCTSVDELNPTFSIAGVRYDGPIEALRQLGIFVPVNRTERLSPRNNEAACKVDYIVNITDAFLKDYMTAVAEKYSSSQRQLAGPLQDAFEILLGKIYPGTPHAKGDCFCVGRALTIADLQVYAVFAILDTVALEGFSVSALVHRGSNRVAIDHCRKIASHEMIQTGKEYYLDNGSYI